MKTFVASMLVAAMTMAQEHRVLKTSPEVRVFGDRDTDYEIPKWYSSDEGILSLSTRTMYNGLSKATHLVGCSMQSGIASLPGVSAGTGYRFKDQRVGYAHYCGDTSNYVHPDDGTTPPPEEDKVVDQPEENKEESALDSIASGAVAVAAALSLLTF